VQPDAESVFRQWPGVGAHGAHDDHRAASPSPYPQYTACGSLPARGRTTASTTPFQLHGAEALCGGWFVVGCLHQREAHQRHGHADGLAGAGRGGIQDNKQFARRAFSILARRSSAPGHQLRFSMVPIGKGKKYLAGAGGVTLDKTVGRMGNRRRDHLPARLPGWRFTNGQT